jgi:uncharacterized membrane protein (UPF0182 family)
MLDANERLRGVIAASAGALRATWWIPLTASPHRWPWIVDHLRATDSAAHDAVTMRGAIRVIPVQNRAVFMVPGYVARPGAAPLLQRLVVMQDDTIRSASTFAEALGVGTAQAALNTANSSGAPLRADSLYRVMRDALKREDWPQFGRALDALGIVLHVKSP